MKVSFNLFGLAPDAYGPLVERADALGFDTVWLAEHLATPGRFDSPYPYRDDGRPPYPVDTPMSDVWSLLGQLSARTRRVRLGTGVYILPLRNTFVTARAAATVQHLSGGRLALGVGAGWLRGEYTAVGASFDDRGSRMEEQIEVLRTLWGPQPASYEGRFHQFSSVHFVPVPDRVPILIGGSSPAAYRRAATMGDGWFGPSCPLEASLSARRDIERLRAGAGRAGEPFEYVVRLDECSAARLQEYQAKGFEHVVTSPSAVANGRVTPDDVDRLAAVFWG